MSALFIAAMLAVAAPVDTAEAEVDQATPAQAEVEQPADAKQTEPKIVLRTGLELKKASDTALKKWAKADDKQASEAAGEFIMLYQELQRDTEMSEIMRDRRRILVRNRLIKLQSRIAKQAKIDRSLAEKAGSGSMTDDTPKTSGARGGAAVMNDDYGEALVDLIHKTISPPTWDVNGGLGAIYYWHNGRAIVIRAPQHVHEEIGGVLEQLHRAGH